MIGDQLKRLMEKRSLTQSELSKITGLTNGHLSKIENNKSRVSVGVLIQLAEALYCSTDELLGLK